MRNASYRFGVAWIALNDDAFADESEIASQISTLLLADLFEVEPAKVAKDVMRFRQKHDSGKS